MSYFTRRNFMLMSGLAGMSLLAGCAGGAQQGSAGGENAASASPTTAGAEASATASADSAANNARTITIGTLPTEDILPFWVADEEDLFSAHGLTVEIVPFQAATELIAGVSSGEVDLAMTDIMVTASMVASGTDVSMQWVTLGATPDQGRFGIMTGPNSAAVTLEDLAGVPIGVGSNTILEYVMDKLMEAAGIPADQVVVEELQKLPVRFQAMMSGEVQAAALPGSLLALGEAQGCTLIADDTQGENLSQSVMIAQNNLLESEEGAQALQVLKEAWDEAVDLINANPEAYRATLVAHANLSEVIAETYPICQYPAAQLPTAAMVDPVLRWMEEKGYLSQKLVYQEDSGALAVQ